MIQENFLKTLQKPIKGVANSSLNRWKSGTSSPTLETVEKICIDNDIELPFFYDGNPESLLEYSKKLGLTIKIILE